MSRHQSFYMACQEESIHAGTVNHATSTVPTSPIISQLESGLPQSRPIESQQERCPETAPAIVEAARQVLEKLQQVSLWRGAHRPALSVSNASSIALIQWPDTFSIPL